MFFLREMFDRMRCSLNLGLMYTGFGWQKKLELETFNLHYCRKFHIFAVRLES